jgi:hypothetical protein
MPWALPIERARLALMALTTLAASCAPAVRALRFENRAPVWRVDDRTSIACPEAIPSDFLAGQVRDGRAAVLYALSVPGGHRAEGINALGEVPDSSWFENRIGVRDITPEALARGPGDGHGPVPPFVVKSTKSGGMALGVIIEDALGERYIVKFDVRGYAEQETGTDPVVSRLLWAAGYHVPVDTVVLASPSDFVVGDDAVHETATGEEAPMTRADLDAIFAAAAPGPSGGVRALASRMLAGEPLGGYPPMGVREDDRNDVVPHQHRRDVRGQHAFFGWLGHSDVKQDNTLDMWLEDAPGSDRGHVRHYLVDFGKALGTKGARGRRPHEGWAHDFDEIYAPIAILTLGIYRMPWEGIPLPALRGVGRYEARFYRPERFRPTRTYIPFLYTDRFDEYWAAKIIARFDRAHIEAAVAEGRFTEEASRDYLVETIITRQRKTLSHWFGEVAPIDYFRIVREGDAALLCADDLFLRYGVEDAAAVTSYEIEAFDHAAEPIGFRRGIRGRGDGLVCVDVPEPPRDHEGYLMVRYRTRRGARDLPPVVAHFARAGGSGALRLIGIDRQ